MTNDDKPQFASLISVLASAWRQELDASTREAYWMALDDLDLAAVSTAVRRAVREGGEFMPSPGTLRGIAAGGQEVAIYAWAALKRAISAHGAWKSIQFEDRALTATVRNLGGWVRICSSDSEELDTWIRKDFERIYASYLRGGVMDDQALPLTGLYEQQGTPTIEKVVTVKAAYQLPALGQQKQLAKYSLSGGR